MIHLTIPVMSRLCVYFLTFHLSLPPVPLFFLSSSEQENTISYVQLHPLSGMDSLYSNGLYMKSCSTSVSTSFRPHFTSTVYNGLWGLMFGQPPPPTSLHRCSVKSEMAAWFAVSNPELKTETLTYCSRPLSACFPSAAWIFSFLFPPLANQTWEEEKEMRAKVRWWWERRDHEVMGWDLWCCSGFRRLLELITVLVIQYTQRPTYTYMVLIWCPHIQDERGKEANVKNKSDEW